MNMPLVLLNRRRRGFTAFSPSTLFALSEPGVWFDPSDLTTLFTDFAGATPVTAPGQTVGLMLDKSKGLVLGPELVANGDFASGTGWTLKTGATISGGVLSINATGDIFDIAGQTGILTQNKWYRVTAVCSSYTSGLVFVALGDAALGSRIAVTGAGTFTALIRHQSGVQDLDIRAFGAGGTGPTVLTLDSVSIKELPGNHAAQETLAARPTYSIEPVGGRRNLLTFSEQMDNAIWVKARASVSPNTATAPDGTLTADKLVEDTATLTHQLYAGNGIVGATLSIYAKAAERSILGIYSGAWFSFNLSSGVATGAGATMVDAGNGWWRCIAPRTNSNTFYLGPSINTVTDDGTWAYTGDGTSGILLWGAQLELGSAATNYQRVTTQHDVTEAGVASVGYLFDDLVSDALNWTAPAGTYSIAFVDNLGNVTIQTSQSLSGATDALAVQKLAGYLAINRALTTAETASLTEWLETKAGV